MKKNLFGTFVVSALALCELNAGLDELSRSVIQLTDDIGVFEEFGTNRLQVFWKLPNTNMYVAKPNVVGGTALLVGSRKGVPFIVTAKHVAAQISQNGTVYLGNTNEPLKIRFGDFVGRQHWIHHPLADISVHPLNPAAPRPASVALWIIPFHLFTNSSAPPRDIELAILGFPFGLGIEGMFSPISRQSKAASAILTEGGVRYFLLQDPSIDGYSGGPVFTVKNPYFLSMTINGQTTPIQIMPSPPENFWGVISATKSDRSGGKVAIVIPASYAVDLMDKFEGFNNAGN
jgi:hypothetical protein